MNEQTIQFLKLFKNEINQSEDWLQNRISQVESKGEYIPTTEELTYGARVAWRNSNKCIGRFFWKTLHVFEVTPKS